MAQLCFQHPDAQRKKHLQDLFISALGEKYPLGQRLRRFMQETTNFWDWSVSTFPMTMRALNFYNQLWRRHNLLKFRSATAITRPVMLRRPNAVSSKATKIGEGGSYTGMFAPTVSAKIKPGVGETAYWLIALAALIALVVGIFFLAESGSTQTTDLYQVRSAAEGIPNQGAVTFDQAIQMLSVRH